ncbi:MAG: hypothetical protein LBK66_11000 [Spirochaetaceae bacterium]|jgi:hypothetical protein|nr:hypothetical protein [Spirochaetaceae bacterium]
MATYFNPIFSYKTISFDNITFHNPTGGLSVIRMNPVSKNLFSVTAMYSAALINGIENNYPDLYHNIILSLNGKINRHSFLGAFVANTDEPVYGGLHTFNAFAGYTYDLVNWPHFSMDVGAYLIFMDIGVNLPDGTPWLVWPLPNIMLKWDYEWIDVSIFSGIELTVADGKPVSLTMSKKSNDSDISLWYHYFRNKTSSTEILGIGIGLKNTTSKVSTFEGNTYGINYSALYGSLRIFRLIELNGGWAFNGKENYGKINWDNLFEMYGYSDEMDYNAEIGNGFFFSVSARLIF